MKKVFSIFIIFLLLGFINVNAAACKSGELTKLNEEANKIKVGYDPIETKKMVEVNALDMDGNPIEGTYEITEDSLKITVYNVTDDIFLIMTNDANDEEVVINSENSPGGNYSFVNENITDIINYKFEIYSNSSCDTTLLKTVKFTKPFMNPNARYEACINNPTVPFCQRYVTKLFNIPEAELVDTIEKYLRGEDIGDTSSNETKNNKGKSNYLIYGAIGGSVVIIAVASYIIISKKRGAL